MVLMKLCLRKDVLAQGQLLYEACQRKVVVLFLLMTRQQKWKNEARNGPSGEDAVFIDSERRMERSYRRC